MVLHFLHGAVAIVASDMDEHRQEKTAARASIVAMLVGAVILGYVMYWIECRDETGCTPLITAFAVTVGTPLVGLFTYWLVRRWQRIGAGEENSHQGVVPDQTDWRLTDQESYLRGVRFQRKPYRVYRESWEHDHCAFCWAKFVDPEHSDAHRRLAEQEGSVTEGYATTSDYPRGADYVWVCADCFSDFCDDFEWVVVT